MTPKVALVYGTFTRRDIAKAAHQGLGVEHVVYGEHQCGTRYKVAILLNRPQTILEQKWIDEELPTRMIPDGRIYRAYEA